VREQFESELRALTDAEQDSKQLKAAKRHLLFDRIVNDVTLPFPVGPAVVSETGETQPGTKDSTTKSYEEGVRGDLQDLVRKKIAVDKRRPDGRGTEEIRPIEVEVTVNPRSHGSALFTRGQTQILSSLTLGTAKEGQRIDDSPRGGAPLHAPLQLPALLGRGDGLHARPEAPRYRPRCAAQRALEAVIPSTEEFPTRSASSPRRSSRTARRRWDRCAARRSP
jgi:hypothetical protein